MIVAVSYIAITESVEKNFLSSSALPKKNRVKGKSATSGIRKAERRIRIRTKTRMLISGRC